MSECYSHKRRRESMDFYSLLEVSPTADLEEIKQAYRKLALLYHPDRNKGKEEECARRFKEVASAYNVLSDPEKRATYDKISLQYPQRKRRRQARFFHSSTEDLRQAFSRLVSSGNVAFSEFFAGDSSSSFSDLAAAAAVARSVSTSHTPEHPSSPNSSSASSSASSSPPSPATPIDDPSPSEMECRESSMNNTENITNHDRSSPPPAGLQNANGAADAFSESRLDLNFTPPSCWLPKKGQTLQTTLFVSFEECVKGCTKTIELDCYDSCGFCRGLGYPEDTQPQVCGMCDGTGTYSQRSSLLTISTMCVACNGSGKKVDTGCTHCEEGRVSRKKRLTVEVPAGVVQGMKKIYTEEGDVGECGGGRGDLIVVFSVETSLQFARQGDDAVTTVPISFFQATLGDHIHVKGLLGQDVRLTIPPGTQPGEMLVVEGEGFPIIHSLPPARGRLLVQVNLVIPRTLSLRQTQLLFKTQQKWDL